MSTFSFVERLTISKLPKEAQLVKTELIKKPTSPTAILPFSSVTIYTALTGGTIEDGQLID